MQKYIIIVAGGKGVRMGGEVPKQFLVIGNKPVLMHTIEQFYQFDPSITIILVLPEEQVSFWQALCEEYSFTVPYLQALGGETRFHSVKNGLELIPGEGVVGVHDGVRPFVSREVIAECYQMATIHQAVIPVIPVYETIRELDNKQSKTVNRENYRLVQTPQVFTVSLLKRAYEQLYNTRFTDDASVVEALNIPVVLVEGNRENIKLTTPFDVKIAKALVNV